MTTFSDEDFATLGRTRLLGDLTDEMMQALLTGARVKLVEKSQILFRQGEPADHFYAVLDGWMKVSRTSASGEEAVLGLFTRGETFAEAAMFLGRVFPATAVAVEPSRLCLFSRKTFEAVAAEDPGVCFAMLGSVSSHLHRMSADVEQLKTRNGEQRLARFLAGLCNASEHACEITLPYDKALIALRLGMRPESLSRHLAKLVGVGVTSNGQSVKIENVKRLKDFGDETPLRRERAG